jgi:hypothetical protein
MANAMAAKGTLLHYSRSVPDNFFPPDPIFSSAKRLLKARERFIVCCDYMESLDYEGREKQKSALIA